MSLGSFDFEAWKQLNNNLKQLQQRTPEFFKECVKELAARLLAKTIAHTPVDTGKLRQGWTVGEIVDNGSSYEVEIINPIEYAMYVEYGHRTRNHNGWVNGRLMLTISVEELEREMPAFLERKLQQFIKNGLGW
ncbi:HK97 gp10 family phage protein [Paenibacillus sp. FSL H8-0034]|uniref:HK97 gp10 family phage protein n=1 Tax=Paenibacillus sp. FSL H8-0034 TaxID=2954671 RepID=UPI0030FBC013